jgi:glycosyltransferase involved in cell wall biosynthesis
MTTGVAVVIPVHNRPRLVVEAIDSVIAQTLKPASLLIVDDGSTDKTADHAQLHLAAVRPALDWRVLSIKRQGAAHARQTGFRLTQPTEAVAFLDSDDLWPSDFLFRAVNTLAQRSKVVGVSADRIRLNCQTLRRRYDDLTVVKSCMLSWIIQNDSGLGSCSVIRSRALQAMGGYPTGERTGHDITLFSKLLMLGTWDHLPGQAVTFRREHVHSWREADHLHRTFPDAALRHAELYERAAQPLLQDCRASKAIRRALARRWVSAAKSSLKQGHYEEGLLCLQNARAHQPFSIRSLRIKCQLHMMNRLANGLRSMLPS